jgi:hypothetical protein
MRFSHIRSDTPKILTAALLCLLSLAGNLASGQKPQQKPKSFSLLNWDNMHGTCSAKGRLQDRDYCRSDMMDQIVAQGKDAIPIIISQLTDERKFKEPIFDYWGWMTVGDLAETMLEDLFLDSDWATFNMPGLERIHPKCETILATNIVATGESCWHALVRKRGRKFIQDQWLAAWNKNKARMYWNSEARCFRLTPEP